MAPLDKLYIKNTNATATNITVVTRREQGVNKNSKDEISMGSPTDHTVAMRAATMAKSLNNISQQVENR